MRSSYWVICAMGKGTRYNPQEAFSWYSKAEEQGNEGAMLNIATMYFTGEGIGRNYAKAINDCLIYCLLWVPLSDLIVLQFVDICYHTEQIRPATVDKFILIITTAKPNIIIESEGMLFPTETYEYGNGEDLPGAGSGEDDL